MWISLAIMWIDVAVVACYGILATKTIWSILALLIPAFVTMIAVLTDPTEEPKYEICEIDKNNELNELKEDE